MYRDTLQGKLFHEKRSLPSFFSNQTFSSLLKGTILLRMMSFIPRSYKVL